MIDDRYVGPARGPKVYLAGPMSGLPDDNFPAFDEAAGALRESYAYRVFNPADNENRDTTKARAVYMRLDFEALLEADLIVFLPGWKNSRGALAEAVVARELGLLAFEFDPPSWRLSRLGLEAAFSDPPAPAEETDPRALVEKAVGLVYGDRNEDYGHPADDYGRTAALWTALLGVEITPAQAALCMVLVKLSREMNRRKPDNVVDAHGYLLVYGRILGREAGNE